MGSFGIVRELFQEIKPAHIIYNIDIHYSVGHRCVRRTVNTAPAESSVGNSRQQQRTVLDNLSVQLHTKLGTLFLYVCNGHSHKVCEGAGHKRVILKLGSQVSHIAVEADIEHIGTISGLMLSHQ